jgi:hypothetical protein
MCSPDIAAGDYDRYMDNVEAVAGLYIMVPEWESFKYQVYITIQKKAFIQM